MAGHDAALLRDHFRRALHLGCDGWYPPQPLRPDLLMIRPIFTEIALFLTPFVLYAVFLWATKAGVLDLNSWPLVRVATLAIAALAMVLGSFIYFAHFSGAPPGSTYVPAHVENGTFGPGTQKGSNGVGGRADRSQAGRRPVGDRGGVAGAARRAQLRR